MIFTLMKEIILSNWLFVACTFAKCLEEYIETSGTLISQYTKLGIVLMKLYKSRILASVALSLVKIVSIYILKPYKFIFFIVSTILFIYPFLTPIILFKVLSHIESKDICTTLL